MITFIHTADIHFGMENYGRIDPATGIHSRLLDFERALSAAVDCAIERDVDFFLFAGDAYKTAHPSPTQQRLLFNCLLRLFKAEIPIVMIVGNHDNPMSFGKAHALDLFGQIPVTGFHVISKPTTLTLKTRRGHVQIVGIPWPSRTTISLSNAHLATSADDLTRLISNSVVAVVEDAAQKLDPHLPAVLAGHLTVSTGIFSGSEKRAVYGTDPLFLPSQLGIPPFDYVALGHLHRHQNLAHTGDTPIIYAGSIERVDFGERKEDKGFCYVTINDEKKASYEFIKTPMRPFIQCDVHLSGTHSQTEEILHALAQHSVAGTVVKIVYHLAADMKDRVDVPTIQNACSSAQHLVGIFPVRPPIIRERRTMISVSMDLETAIATFCAEKEDLRAKKDTIIARVRELDADLKENV